MAGDDGMRQDAFGGPFDVDAAGAMPPDDGPAAAPPRRARRWPAALAALAAASLLGAVGAHALGLSARVDALEARLAAAERAAADLDATRARLGALEAQAGRQREFLEDIVDRTLEAMSFQITALQDGLADLDRDLGARAHGAARSATAALATARQVSRQFGDFRDVLGQVRQDLVTLKSKEAAAPRPILRFQDLPSPDASIPVEGSVR